MDEAKENEIIQKIKELENKIAALPSGYISKKNINGKVRSYYQWTEDGIKKSRYLGETDNDAAKLLSGKIAERRNLQRELRTAKAEVPRKVRNAALKDPIYRTDVIFAERLAAYVKTVRKFRARRCLSDLRSYLFDDESEKVFIMYGLRRTGKTTLIRQAIAGMSKEDFSKTAFIQIRKGLTLADVNHDLKILQERGCRFVFIDEVTFMEDFIEGAALFSDIFASAGMKIVLSGTDSLGFLFSEEEQLYDRCILLHTTWIPYREFEDVLGISGIDEYIRYGGTMSIGGINYNEKSTFASEKSTEDYVDSAIAKNIQHSLICYQDSGHFRSLQQLYEKNGLTSAINRIVEDINHRFTLEVLTQDFKSHDFGISARNLRHDREHPTDVFDKIDKETFTERLKNILEILNKNEQSVSITDAHRAEIHEYLNLLDITFDIPIEKLPADNTGQIQTIISQPGIRYSQAKALIDQLMADAEFQNISAADRSEIANRILDEIRGRMMEEIVLLETKMAFPHKKIFKLQFAVGEFDMVCADTSSTTCEIYEIKHSTKTDAAQYRHIADTEKCTAAEFRYGTIVRRCVLYRGSSKIIDGIEFKNVEEYLKQLPCKRCLL